MKTFEYLIVFGLASVYGRDVYTSINWDPRNPIFKADGKNCGAGPRQLKVRLNSQIYLVCPNLATVLQARGTDVQTSDMKENIWLFHNKTAFDECDVSQVPPKNNRFLCDNPTGLVFLSLLFLEHAAGQDDRTFEGGRTYYLIATSDGTQSSVNDLSGGHCNDTSKNVHMKIEVYVCNKTGDHICNSTNVGILTCPLPATTAPHSPPYTTTSTHGTNLRINTTVPIMTNKSVTLSNSTIKEANLTTTKITGEKTTETTTQETTTPESTTPETTTPKTTMPQSRKHEPKQMQGKRIGESHEVVGLQKSHNMWMAIAISSLCFAVTVIVIFVVRNYCSGKKNCRLVIPTTQKTPKPGLGTSNGGYVGDTMTKASVYETVDRSSSQQSNRFTIETTSFNHHD